MSQAISSRSALILIVFAQFLGTSLWFAGNAAAPELESIIGESGLVSSITSSVQFGFLIGTLIFAFLSIPDRFSPSKVFMVSALLAASFGVTLTILPLGLSTVLGLRFLTGFFLAGIYPVGMKIASDYFKEGLGSALGFLVGALVLGTAFPFLLKAMEWKVDWRWIFWTTSGLAAMGGLLVGWTVPDGPYRKANPKFDLRVIPSLLRNRKLLGAASGYFGHMWELYTFWAFLPALILFLSGSGFSELLVSRWTFIILASGAISCAIGGWISIKKGSEPIALLSLLGSGVCGVILLLFPSIPSFLVLPFLWIWGVLVVADSPQFSTLVAQSTPAEHRGTALTLVNSLGFGLTILSIQTAQFLFKSFEVPFVMGALAIGPLFGLFLYKFFRGK